MIKEEAGLYVVLFNAKVRRLDAEYARIAQRMRTLAPEKFGCLEFHAVTKGTLELAVSYWDDEAAIKAWKAHAEHVVAQQLGRERWYESYTV